MKIALIVEGKTEKAFLPHLRRFLETRPELHNWGRVSIVENIGPGVPKFNIQDTAPIVEFGINGDDWRFPASIDG